MCCGLVPSAATESVGVRVPDDPDSSSESDLVLMLESILDLKSSFFSAASSISSGVAALAWL